MFPISNGMKSRGYGMVEAVMAVAIAASFILILAGINLAYGSLAFGQSNGIQASFLAEESLEAVRYLRDTSWTSYISPLTPGTTYYTNFINNNSYKLQSTSSPIGIFTRAVKFDSVYRDSGGNIVTSGGSLDNKTYLVTSTVTWNERGATSTKVLQMYLSKLFDN